MSLAADSRTSVEAPQDKLEQIGAGWDCTESDRWGGDG
jgi:hypothetical protein